MNIAEMEHAINGTKPMPRCANIEKQFMAKKAKEYSCPECGEQTPDVDNGYDINNEHYPKCFNERKGSTIDGNYWDWDEVHCCRMCKTIFWFSNGAY